MATYTGVQFFSWTRCSTATATKSRWRHCVDFEFDANVDETLGCYIQAPGLIQCRPLTTKQTYTSNIGTYM